MTILSRKDLRKIKFLYYKQEYSAREIAGIFKVSIDAVYYLMRRYNLIRRNPFESNRIRFEKKKLSFNPKKRLTEKEKQLKIAGLMLYWAEGANKIQSYKGQSRGGTVDLANSNPEMIKLFLKFLRKICGVNEQRLRIYLYCYANQNVNSLKKYWSKITNIPLNQFIKPYIRHDFLPEKRGKMKYGLVHIRYADKKLLLQIQDWIKKYLEKNNI